MKNKIFLLCVVFLLIIVQSIALDSFRRLGKKDNDDNDEKDVVHTEKYNQVDDDLAELSTYRRQQYPPQGSSSNKYRSRSRSRGPSSLPSPFDDRLDDSDWSPYGYGQNNMLYNLPSQFSPAPFETGPYLSSGPSCHSLLDPIYPIFSDICGSVPQARYSLPNAFGHFERWQIAQSLSVLLGPSTPAAANPVCGRSLRLLLCPLLFPPCPTRFSAPPVLPCQPFCRAVKNQCANPSLELLPCDLLPPTSDLCPINPTPYSSLLSSFGPPSPFAGPLPSFGGPQSALSSILAQSALAGGFSPMDFSSPPFSAFSQPPFFPGEIPPPGIAPVGGSPLFNPSGFPSPFPGAMPPFSGAMPPFPGAMSPFPGAMSPPGIGPAGPSPLFNPSGLPPPSAMPPFLSPSNPFMNADPYMADSLTPILVDFPPLQLLQGFPQASRYFPLTRSATEQV